MFGVVISVAFPGGGGGYLMAGPSNDGGEDSAGRVISCKASLDQAGAVVAHKGGSLFVVTHGWALMVVCDGRGREKGREGVRMEQLFKPFLPWTA